MDAPQIIADSLRELADALNKGHRAVKAVEDAERERTAELRRQVEAARHKAFEKGRREGYEKGRADGYADGLAEGRGLQPDERETVYAEGFAEGVRLSILKGVRQ